MTRSTPRIGATLAALAAAGLLAACGSSDKTSSATTAAPSGGATTSGASGATGADAKVAALVPAALKSKGTLTVASDASYAPMEFIGADGKTVEGWDADMAKALGRRHGR